MAVSTTRGATNAKQYLRRRQKGELIWKGDEVKLKNYLDLRNETEKRKIRRKIESPDLSLTVRNRTILYRVVIKTISCLLQQLERLQSHGGH